MNEVLQRAYLLIGGCAFFTILTLWNLWAMCFESVNTSIPSVAVIKTTTQSNMIKRLSTPFFGVYTPQLSDEAIERSRLNYEIVGILFSPDAKLSQVVLRDDSGAEKVYRVGESLQSEVLIKAIEAHRVVLSNQGNWESLSLPENELRFEHPPKPFIMKE